MDRKSCQAENNLIADTPGKSAISKDACLSWLTTQKKVLLIPPSLINDWRSTKGKKWSFNKRYGSARRVACGWERFTTQTVFPFSAMSCCFPSCWCGTVVTFSSVSTWIATLLFEALFIWADVGCRCNDDLTSERIELNEKSSKSRNEGRKAHKRKKRTQRKTKNLLQKKEKLLLIELMQWKTMICSQGNAWKTCRAEIQYLLLSSVIQIHFVLGIANKEYLSRWTQYKSFYTVIMLETKSSTSFCLVPVPVAIMQDTMYDLFKRDACWYQQHPRGQQIKGTAKSTDSRTAGKRKT